LSLLQEFVRDYPYCQTGHLLLTRSMFLQDHVMYDRQLKRTAAAVPDRTTLFNLSHGEKEPVAASVFKTDVSTSPFTTEEASYPLQAHTLAQDVPDSPFAERWNIAGIPVQEKIPAPLSRTSRVNFHPTLDEEVPAAVSAAYELMGDRHEIIRKKLEELLVRPAIITPPSAPTTTAQEPTSSAPEPSPLEKDVFMFSDPSAEDEERLFREMELGHAFEESFLRDLEKLPAIVAEQKEAPAALAEVSPTSPKGGNGFFFWLKKTNRPGFGDFEEVEAGPEDPPSAVPATILTYEPAPTVQVKVAEAIIDEFIRTSPRIIPQPKAEFYSPAVQARRSVEEHEDLVSETLARIYADQGNPQKARWCYERLSLLHPEKKAYFAALIKNIDQQPYSGSEDL